MRGKIATWSIALVLAFVACMPGISMVSEGGIGYATHDPIYIESDDNFTQENGVVSGDGSAEKPYVIRGWDINASGTIGIRVENVTSHFVIDDVRIRSDAAVLDYPWVSYTKDVGIRLRIVAWARVHATVFEHNMYGLYCEESNTIILESCMFISNSEAFEVMNCAHLDVASCTFNGNTVTTGYASSTDDVSLNHNTVASNWGGFRIYGCADLEVTDNTFRDSGYALTISSSAHADIARNRFVENTLEGLGVSYCTDGEIDVHENLFEGNTAGVYATEPGALSVYENDFIDNTLAAYDDGLGTSRWNASKPKGGNYWSDYDGSDSNLDGFGDTPRGISGNVSDTLPQLDRATSLRAPSDGVQAPLALVLIVVAASITVVALLLVLRRRGRR